MEKEESAELKALRVAKVWLDTLIEVCEVDPADTNIRATIVNKADASVKRVETINLATSLAEIETLLERK